MVMTICGEDGILRATIGWCSGPSASPAGSMGASANCETVESIIRQDGPTAYTKRGVNDSDLTHPRTGTPVLRFRRHASDRLRA
jgi:hypothetical protein